MALAETLTSRKGTRHCLTQVSALCVTKWGVWSLGFDVETDSWVLMGDNFENPTLQPCALPIYYLKILQMTNWRILRGRYPQLLVGSGSASQPIRVQICNYFVQLARYYRC